MHDDKRTIMVAVDAFTGEEHAKYQQACASGAEVALLAFARHCAALCRKPGNPLAGFPPALVNAIANVSVETGIGNVGVGMDQGGMTVTIDGNQLRLPSDQPLPLPPQGVPPPRIAPTQPQENEPQQP